MRTARGVLVSLLLILPGYLAAQDLGRDSLKGLKTVCVQVQKLSASEQASRAGISEAQLKNDLELRLRKARLPVVDCKSSVAYLYVKVHMTAMNFTSKDSAPPFAWIFSIQIGLFQSVTLGRDRSISCPAMTWSAGYLGSDSPEGFVPHVREAAGDAADEFIKDYLAVNP